MKWKGEQGFTSVILATDDTVPNALLRWVLLKKKKKKTPFILYWGKAD